MTALLSTLGSVLVAWFTATLLGLTVGYLSVWSPRGRAFSVWLTELRGGLPAVVLLALLSAWVSGPNSLLLGFVVGVSQAAAIARWMSSTHGQWSASVVSEVLLGKRASFLAARTAATRGAVRGVSATIPMHVVLSEVAREMVTREPSACLGQVLLEGHPRAVAAALLCVLGLTLLAEWLGSAWVLGRVLVRKRPGW